MNSNLIREIDDPLICMGVIDGLKKYGFDFQVEHIDGTKMTASEQFLRTAFYVRRHHLRNDSLEIYYSYLALYNKESRWVDLCYELECETGHSITDFKFLKNGKFITFDPSFYPDLESYADFIAKLASSKSCRVRWSRIQSDSEQQ